MLGYGPDWGMMGGWGATGWIGPLHMIIWLLVFVLVIAALVWFVRAMVRPLDRSRSERRSAGLDVLEERYARGEIGRDEFLQKKRDISG